MVAGESSNSTNTTNEPTDGIRPALPQRDRWLGLLVVYVVVLGLTGAKLWRPDTVFGGPRNAQIAEAQAWWNGQLDLPHRPHDTALPCRDAPGISHR